MNAASSARLATDWAECELKEVAPATRHGGQSLSLRSGTFATPEMAQEAGTRAQAALLLLAARAGFGVTLAARVPGGVITAYGKQILGQGRFDNILDDQYGLTVFEDNGRTGFASMGESSATVSQSALSFFDDWRSALSADPQADARVLVSHDLWANSRFESSSRARFLLLVMSVEALLTPPRRTERELAVVEQLLSHVAAASELTTDQRQALRNGVSQLKTQSFGFAGRVLLQRAVADSIVSDADAPKVYAESYGVRSKIVHGGGTPDPAVLSTRSNRLETIVRELLVALLERKWA